MLHHVSLEVKPENAEPTIAFFEAIGFARVRAPEPIAPYVSWLERESTQIHLIHTPEPTIPALGHPAVVVAEFDRTVQRLRDSGFEVEHAEELWGERRAFAIMPGGGRVELMDAPPPAIR